MMYTGALRMDVLHQLVQRRMGQRAVYDSLVEHGCKQGIALSEPFVRGVDM